MTPSPAYPFAPAPDIIRAHQKDTHLITHLSQLLATLAQHVAGSRRAHALLSSPSAGAPSPAHTAAHALYLGLTTLAGSRTLGEEYADVVTVHAPSPLLPLRSSSSSPSSPTAAPAPPTISRRAAYVIAAVLVPHALSRVLPRLRTRLRALIDARAAALPPTSAEARLWRYLSGHLAAGAAVGAAAQALCLAVFYLSGTYYELAKRVLGLRYVFTRRVPDSPDRGGYEVLGVLLMLQMAVQAFMHVRTALVLEGTTEGEGEGALGVHGTTADLLLSSSSTNSGASSRGLQSRINLAAATHTPVPALPRLDLGDEAALAFVRGEQQRKCTLCLDDMRDPAATPCGHVFCWSCIGDWVREKPECPLCRRGATAQHMLPLRAPISKR